MSSPCYDHRYLEALTDHLENVRERLALAHIALFNSSTERPCALAEAGAFPVHDALDTVPVRQRFRATLVDAGSWTLTALRRTEQPEAEVVDELMRFAERIEHTMWRMLGDAVDPMGRFAQWRECGGRFH